MYFVINLTDHCISLARGLYLSTYTVTTEQGDQAMKKTIGYTRVSTAEQATEGVSLDMQARKIVSYCDVKDWTLDEVITDEGESAKSLNRPGVARLIDMVEAGEVSTVIVYKLDRLTRSVADLDRLVKLFEREGVALVSLQESLDATTATGRLMMNLLASVSQWEREVIGERTKDALQELKAQGKKLGRIGFTDASVIEEIKAQRANGWTFQDITADLNARQVPTARGGTWSVSTVYQIVARA
jgi:site-specific DNA recombinase